MLLEVRKGRKWMIDAGSLKAFPRPLDCYQQKFNLNRFQKRKKKKRERNVRLARI